MKKYIPPQKFNKQNMLVKVKYIYTALKKVQTLLQCTNNNCSFAIFLFPFFVLAIGILH